MIRQAIAVVGLLGFALVASAAPITFVVSGLFTTGATFSGTFTLDGATNTLVDSSITTATEPGFPGTTYMNSGVGSPWIQGNNATSPNDFTVFLVTPGFDQFLFFWLGGSPDTFTGGAIEQIGASCGVGLCTPSAESYTSGSVRLIESGTVTALPEPATGLLMGSVLGAMLLVRKRFRR